MRPTYLLGARAGAGLFAGTVAICLAWVCWSLWRMHAGLFMAPAGPIERSPLDWSGLCRDYATGIVFALNLIGFGAMTRGRSGMMSGPVVRFVSWAAGATFTPYLLHRPTMVFLAAASPWPQGTPTDCFYRLER